MSRQRQPESHWDQRPTTSSEIFPKPHTNLNNYIIGEEIGEGSFGTAYLAVNKNSGNQCVIKLLLFDTSEIHHREEATMMWRLKESPNIVKIIDTVQDQMGHQFGIVMEYLEAGDDSKIKEFGVSKYLKQILQGLHYIHSHGIIHRDIKPTNVMFDVRKTQVKIIDFGVSTYYFQNKDYITKVGSLYYRAPELFLGYSKYNYAIDVWSFGCIMGSRILDIDILFIAQLPKDVFAQIVSALGTASLSRYMHKYSIKSKLANQLAPLPEQGIGFTRIRGERSIQETLALDLMKSILCFDHNKRLTAEQALRHDFFRQESSQAKK